MWGWSDVTGPIKRCGIGSALWGGGLRGASQPSTPSCVLLHRRVCRSVVGVLVVRHCLDLVSPVEEHLLELIPQVVIKTTRRKVLDVEEERLSQGCVDVSVWGVGTMRWLMVWRRLPSEASMLGWRGQRSEWGSSVR